MALLRGTHIGVESQPPVPFRKLKVLVACESSHQISGRFRALGHEAYSCDMLEADNAADAEWHIQGDARIAIHATDWDLVIAHPPCTYLCGSGLHWNTRRDKKTGELLRPGRQECTEKAADFFMEFTDLKCPWAIENPVGYMSSYFKPADQYVQPYMFGDDASKKTGFWLHKLPPLIVPDESEWAPPRLVKYIDKETGEKKTAKRWANQTDSGQNNCPPGPDQWKIRSKTYPGIADAIVEQWGNHVMRALAEQEEADWAPDDMY